MKTNNNCTCIIGSKDNKCIVHGLIGGSDVGGEVLRVYPGRENEKNQNMKTTYLKCIHGNDKRFGCQQCEVDKNKYFTGVNESNFDKTKETKIPIYRGCGNRTCFCTGRCKEIIGYREYEAINDLEFLTSKTPEQEIKELEEVILNQQEKIVELTKQNKILNQQLFGHLKSTNY